MADYDTGRGGEGFDNFGYDGNEPRMGQFEFNNNNNENDNQGQTGYNENSLQLDKVFDKNLENPKFVEKEAEYSKKIEDMINERAGKYNITSNWPKVVYIGNKILMGMILFASLLDRFDVVGLTVCFVIFFLEIGFFDPRHLYKWVALMICSIAIDVLVFLDILFVSFIFFISNYF